MAVLSVTAPFGFDFDVVRFLRAYGRLGATSAQFYRNEQHPPTVKQALDAAATAGITFDSIHGVFGEHIDPSSDDPSERARCVSIYAEEGKLALDLDGPMVVVHPSCWNAQRFEMSRDEAVRAAAPRWARLNAFMRELANVGEKLGVTYLVENQPFNCPMGHDPSALASAILSVGSPRIRMCFDTGHAHITSNLISQLHQCAPAIAYLHIHDNNGKDDTHLMPGSVSKDELGRTISMVGEPGSFESINELASGPAGGISWYHFAEAVRKTELHCVRMLEVFEPEAVVERRVEAGFGRQLRSMLAL